LPRRSIAQTLLQVTSSSLAIWKKNWAPFIARPEKSSTVQSSQFSMKLTEKSFSQSTVHG
jgi:hypothetical protein